METSSAPMTMTGLTWEQAIAALKQVLPETAYKAIDGSRFGGTDINPAYLTERATEIFGPCGVGWAYDYDEENVEVKEVAKTTRKGEVYTVWQAWLKRLDLLVRWEAESGYAEKGRIISTGYSEGENPAYALRGAVTNALGAAFSKLCWQIHIYKGERVEHPTTSQARPIARPQEPPKPPQASNGSAERPYPPEKVRAGIEEKIMRHAGDKPVSEKHRGFVRGALGYLFEGDEQEDVATKVHSVLAYLFGKSSTKELLPAEFGALCDWLQIKQDTGGEITVAPMAIKEAQAIVVRRMSELGQDALFAPPK